MNNPTLPELARVQAQRDRLRVDLDAAIAMRDLCKRQLDEVLALYQPIRSVLGDWDWAAIVEDGRHDYERAITSAVKALAEVERRQKERSDG